MPLNLELQYFRLVLLFACIGFTSSCSLAKSSSTNSLKSSSNEKVVMKNSKSLQSLFTEYKEFVYRQYPIYATYQGDTRYNDKLGDISLQGHKNRREKMAMFYAQAEKEVVASQEDKLNKSLFLLLLRYNINSYDKKEFYYGLEQLDGLHISFPQIVSFTPFNTEKDFENYVKRLNAFPKQVEDLISLLSKGVDDGYSQPKIIVQKVVTQITSMVNTTKTSVEKSPFYSPLMNKSINSSLREKFKEDVRVAIQDKVQPAYESMLTFIKTSYLPKTRDAIGVSKDKNGKDYYKNSAKFYTTTDLTPDKIFDMGLSEVKRIKHELEKTIKETGFEGNFQEFTEYLHKNKDFYYTNEDSLLQGYRDILSVADKMLPRVLGRIPKSPYEIVKIESYRSKSAPQAYYYSVPEDFSRPGRFYVNTYDLSSRPIYTMTALALHEAVPGHHIQIATSVELKNMPWFRKNYPATAFIEGWALYAEFLGYELGMYDDVYQKIGALDFEIWRACRLVVDVGIHYKNWTRDQAIEYLKENSFNSELDIISEIDRYIAWPGQALAYKIGELKIKELRKKATRILGEKFDVRKFHDTVLSSGSLPLKVLEEKIDAWIESQT